MKAGEAGQGKLRKLRLIAISGAEPGIWPAREAKLQAALEAGLPALMLREHAGSDEALRPLAERLRALTREAGALFLMNRRPALAREVGADGIHVGAEGPTIAEAREAIGEAGIVGYSAHARDEALRAFDVGADYVFLSPIFGTPSKQGILAPLGLATLAELCRVAPGPTLALGGIDANNLEQVFAAGAHGVAAIRALWNVGDAADAIRVVTMTQRNR